MKDYTEKTNEFKEAYFRLQKNLQNIINETIRRMSKIHHKEYPKKYLDIPKIIKYYRKKRNLTVEELLSLCSEAGYNISENTYKSIMKRNVVRVRNNETLKALVDVLKIPTNESGSVLYIERFCREIVSADQIKKQKKTVKLAKQDKHIKWTIKNKKLHQILFTSAGSDYILEFQNNSVFSNFNCLDHQNQRAIIFLIKSLYDNQMTPERFMNNENIISL